MRGSASYRKQPCSCFWFVLLRPLISIIRSTGIDNNRGILGFPAHKLSLKYDWSIGWLCLLWLATLTTWVFKRNSIQKPRFMLNCCRKVFFALSGFQMKNTSEYPCRTCFLENLLNLLKTPFWFVWRETGNKQFEKFNRANTTADTISPADCRRTRK